MQEIIFGEEPLCIEDICRISYADYPVRLSSSTEFKERVMTSRQHLEALLRKDSPVYGVTTGYGDSCTVEVIKDLHSRLPMNLIRFHNCGLGDNFEPTQTRAIIATRMASLCRGFSGVRLEVLEHLALQLNHQICPRMPQEGSVGASGDLTPLSYLAATVAGEGEVFFENELHKAQTIFAKLGIKPLALLPKEALAIMNGTSVMTALACLAYYHAEYLTRLISRITALCCLAVRGNFFHFDPRIFAAKPHAGQILAAQRIREDLEGGYKSINPQRLQDRYSLRCAPHVIGVLQDSLPLFRQLIETELNSSNDNPLIDPETGDILHGGNFYGGHMAFVTDSLKSQVANLADLMDRQLALLMDPNCNNGLPSNLSGASDKELSVCHGFKAVQIGASAWTAEALSKTMPISSFSRSTECHNQDKVSMGTISARECLRVLTLTEQVAAASLLASYQGVLLRIQRREFDLHQLSPSLHSFIEEISKDFELLEADRPLEPDLRAFTKSIREQKWKLYEDADA